MSLGPIAADLVEETVRILRFAKERALVLRLIGATAYITHCHQFGYLQGKLGRALSDIDFAGRSAQSSSVRELFSDLGYEERGMINMLFAKERLVFFDDDNKRHVDVFFDRLSFNHEINLTDRLEITYPTIPPVARENADSADQRERPDRYDDADKGAQGGRRGRGNN
jgi:hypothetical protein